MRRFISDLNSSAASSVGMSVSLTAVNAHALHGGRCASCRRGRRDSEQQKRTSRARSHCHPLGSSSLKAIVRPPTREAEGSTMLGQPPPRSHGGSPWPPDPKPSSALARMRLRLRGRSAGTALLPEPRRRGAAASARFSGARCLGADSAPSALVPAQAPTAGADLVQIWFCSPRGLP
jgi:hypothetical protein